MNNEKETGETEQEQTREEIRGVLEKALNDKKMVDLSVREKDDARRQESGLVSDLEGDAYVWLSRGKLDPVLPIEISTILKAELKEEQEAA